jgi:hypothetical protein
MKKPKKPDSKEPIVTTTLRMPKSLWQQVQHSAIDENKGIAELILDSVREHLKGGSR